MSHKSKKQVVMAIIPHEFMGDYIIYRIYYEGSFLSYAAGLAANRTPPGKHVHAPRPLSSGYWCSLTFYIGGKVVFSLKPFIPGSPIGPDVVLIDGGCFPFCQYKPQALFSVLSRVHQDDLSILYVQDWSLAEADQYFNIRNHQL